MHSLELQGPYEIHEIGDTRNLLVVKTVYAVYEGDVGLSQPVVR